MNRDTALGVLLCELFSAEALRQFLRSACSAAIATQLPAAPRHAGEVHRCAVALLGDAGLVDRELFARIATQFPAQRHAIQRVAARWVNGDGSQRRVAVMTDQPVPIGAPAGGAGTLQLSKILLPRSERSPDVIRFEIRAGIDCFVYWCGVSAAKVIRQDATWKMWAHTGVRFRHGIGPIAAGEVIAVLVNAGASDVVAILAERASQLIQLAPDQRRVLAGDVIAELEVPTRDFGQGFLIDPRGSDFGGVLRWQPALSDPVWLGSFSEPNDPAASASECDHERGLHVVRARDRGVIVELAPGLKPGVNVGRDQLLCWQQLDDRRIDLRAPRTARVEEIHVRAGAKVRRDQAVISLRHSPARPRVRVSIFPVRGSRLLYVIHAPLPGVLLGPEHPSAAETLREGQLVEREKPLCTILGGLSSVPCDVFADIYGSVTQVLAPTGPVRRGQRLLEVRVDRSYILAPFVGTYYKASNPDSEPYVHVGKSIGRGDVVCIIEALKLPNEVESDVDGIVEQVLIENGHPAEYGQPLMIIRVDDDR